MNISLDYDETYTRDPELWNEFIAMCRDYGHTVYCVTLRTPEEGAEVTKALAGRVKKILFTSRKSKKDYCAAHHVRIDVWIDDMPMFINKDFAA